MSEHPTPPVSKTAEPATPPLTDLPPRAADRETETPNADAVTGGLGINRIVVTDGKISP